MEASLKLKGKIDVIEPVVSFSYKWAINLGLSNNSSAELALAVDELVTDVILHALKDEEAEFEMNFFSHPSFIEISLKEFGEPFESEKYPYNSKKAINEGLFQGSGFEIIKKMTDNFVFINHGKAGKEFRLVKNIESQHVSNLKKELLEEIETETEIEIQEFSFLPVVSDDCEDIAKLIYRTYSYSYPKEDLYYPDRIVKYLETGKKFAVIARNAKNKPCGYFAVIRYQNSKIGEVGEAVVSPEYRGKGIMTIMMTMLINMSREKKLEGLFGEAVTFHTISQRVNAKFNFNSTAILLDLYPTAQQKGFLENKQVRPSVVVEFLPLVKRKELWLYLPPRYKNILKLIFKSIGIEVKDKKLTKYTLATNSSFKIEINYKYGNTCIKVDEYGLDFIDRIKKKLKSLVGKNIKTVYIDLPLHHAHTKVVIEDLNNLGFLFSGLMPIFYKQKDYLRLQKISGKFEPQYINLLSDISKKIKRQIQKDILWITK